MYIILLLLLSGLLFGCVKRQEKDPYTLNVSLDSEPPTLDWNYVSEATSNFCIRNLMDGLVSYDWSGPEVQSKPALAESWEISQNDLVYTFHLRKGMKWSDGVELTSQHFVDSWRRLADPKIASSYAYYLMPIKNWEKVTKGKLPPSEIGVEAPDPYTLKVTLEKPRSYFLDMLTYSVTYPIRLDVIQNHGEKWTEPGNIVTLGPFTLKKWEHDKRIVFERNENYWDKKPFLKTINVPFVSEISTTLNLFETEQLDILLALPMMELERYQKDPKLKSLLQSGPLFSITYFGFNTKKPPFDNPFVRKAFSAAINRKELLSVIRRNYYPITSWIPVKMFGYNPNIGIPFNPEKAREYLQNAGYEQREGNWVNKKDGKPFPKIQLAIDNSESLKVIAENLQIQWKKHLGIEPEIESKEFKVYVDTITQNPPHIWWYGWNADFPDPDTFMGVFISDSNQNFTGWKNKEYDQLVEKAAMIPNSPKRKELYDKAQRILLEQGVPFIPLYTRTYTLATQPYIKNYTGSPIIDWRFDTVRIER